MVGLLTVTAVAVPVLSPVDPTAVDLMQRLEPPSAAHWLGTDHLGRDLLARLAHGASVSLGMTAVILALILTLGIGVGGLSGFLGGRADRVIMRVCDVFLTFPTFVLAMFMVGVLGTGLVAAAVTSPRWGR